jgi:hypothetical protein
VEENQLLPTEVWTNLLVSNQASVQVSLIQAQSKQCDTQLGFVTVVGVSKNTFNNTCLMY